MRRCVEMFGKGTRPDVHKVNMVRGGRDAESERIIFVAGVDDPWREAGDTYVRVRVGNLFCC
jgi:hypothetical protein